MEARKLRSCLVGAFLLVAALATAAHGAPPVSNVIEGNPKCKDIDGDEGWNELKVEPPQAGTFTDTGTRDSDGQPGPLVFEIKNFDGKSVKFDWSAQNEAVDAVIVKGGPNAKVYFYDPEAASDTNLTTPTNPKNNKPYGFSHISVCYDVGTTGDGTTGDGTTGDGTTGDGTTGDGNLGIT